MNGKTTTMRNGACRGFTLVELLVVIAMLMLLMGSVTSAIMTAQRRAKIAKATVEIKEMTNAILAFENYSSDGLSAQASGSWQEATEASLAFILGKVTGQNGERVPVLYNAAIRGGKVLDPWGHPYYVQIKQGKVAIQNNGSNGSLSSTQTAVAFPNFYRRQAEEN